MTFIVCKIFLTNSWQLVFVNINLYYAFSFFFLLDSSCLVTFVIIIFYYPLALILLLAYFSHIFILALRDSFILIDWARQQICMWFFFCIVLTPNRYCFHTCYRAKANTDNESPTYGCLFSFIDYLIVFTFLKQYIICFLFICVIYPYICS